MRTAAVFSPTRSSRPDLPFAFPLLKGLIELDRMLNVHFHLPGPEVAGGHVTEIEQ
jgi:hypothetical protein